MPDKNLFTPVKINLVETSEWKKHWDLGGDIGEQASNQAYGDWRNTTEKDCTYLISDLFGERLVGPHEWSPRKISIREGSLEKICEALRESVPELELTHQAIIDTLTWMYEDAIMPSNNDIESAMDYTSELMKDDPDIAVIWEPIQGLARYEEDELIVESLLDEISYERQEGHYDRYIVFDLGNAEATKELLRQSSDRSTLSDLKYEFDYFRDEFMGHFWDALQDEMEYADIYNRTNFKKHWKETLKDSNRMKAVQKELRTFLKG